ncbi:MAG TPA: purine-nucleoside phosphorylase [Bacteroidota bacterium]|jgi:purine-nucleoside phosphorylase
MTELRKNIDEAVAFLRTKTSMKPTVGIILGTGLGGLAKEIKAQTVIEYGDIPHFPLSTVESHHGKLIFGKLGNKDVVAMQGRFHYYEGYTMQQVTFPVRVMKFLGITTLLISNAAGGMNPQFRKGSVMIITDHINLIGDNPLIGPNDDTIGPRFPDMSEPYNRDLIALAEQVALEMKIRTERGVFVAVAGPNLETRAEYRFLRFIGADAVGMSTVPENIVAVHMGLNVVGFSIITDECFPDALEPANVEAIIAVASSTEPKLTAIMKGVVERLPS